MSGVGTRGGGGVASGVFSRGFGRNREVCEAGEIEEEIERAGGESGTPNGSGRDGWRKVESEVRNVATEARSVMGSKTCG